MSTFKKEKYKYKYKVIKDPSKRLEIIKYAKEYTWRQALKKYGISIGTLKRWHAKCDGTSESLKNTGWVNTSHARGDKYYHECCSLKYQEKTVTINTKYILEYFDYKISRSTAWRLLKYFKKHHFPNYQADRIK